MPTPRVIGIVNLTTDSFSDGGRYLAAADALTAADVLLAAGADVIELGAESSQPDAESVSAELEIQRLAPVLESLVARGVVISVDSRHVATQRWAIAAGAAYLNDITGFARPEFYPELAACDCRLVVMHSVGSVAKAERVRRDSEPVRSSIESFFDERIDALKLAGIARERLVLDPGMGLFLSSDPQASIEVLRALPSLRERFGLATLVSVSRKSFLGAITGRGIAGRGPATLAAELYAATRGVDYIRTHDAGALVDGLAVFTALGALPSGRVG
jgi:dihydropteroate synthase type 2